MNPEELERMKNHVREALVRAGAQPSTLTDKSLENTARFIHESRVAPSDYTMTLIHRVIKWHLGEGAGYV